MRKNVPDQTPPAGVILFGKDKKNKPHASFFGKADLAAAVKAAHLMGMQAVVAETPGLRAVVAELTPGRVFARRAFVPFVKAEVYRRLITLAVAAGAFDRQGAAHGLKTPKPSPTAPPEALAGPTPAADNPSRGPTRPFG